MPGDSRPLAEKTFNDRGSLLDPVNRRLLSELCGSPRLSMSELARRVGMSAPAVTERVQRLESAGVIAGYRVDLDPAALGLPVTALVRIRPGPGQLPKIAQTARDTPEVVECYRVTGEDCFSLKVHAPSIPDLEQILDRFLLFGQTSTIMAGVPAVIDHRLLSRCRPVRTPYNTVIPVAEHGASSGAVPTFISPDGTELAYHVSGDGVPVVCLPGGPMQDSGYLGDLGGLSAYRRLVMVDPRGTGQSAVPRCRTHWTPAASVARCAARCARRASATWTPPRRSR